MLFIVRFEDRPQAMALRRQHQPAQEAYIAARRDTIRASGPLHRDDLGRESGGLWYVDAPDRRSAEAVCHASPYWQAGVHNRLTVMPQQTPAHPYANVRVTCL